MVWPQTKAVLKAVLFFTISLLASFYIYMLAQKYKDVSWIAKAVKVLAMVSPLRAVAANWEGARWLSCRDDSWQQYSPQYGP